MKTIIIALVLSVASLFAGAQTAQSATVVASEFGPIIPAIPAGLRASIEINGSSL